MREIVHDLLADELLQCLRRAAAEGAVAGAAVEARDREFVGEAVAAVDLDCLVVTRIAISLQYILATAA